MLVTRADIINRLARENFCEFVKRVNVCTITAFITIFTSSFSFSDNVLNISDSQLKYPLNGHVVYLETRQEFGINEVRSLPDQRWKKVNEKKGTFGYSDSAYWLRITLKYNNVEQRHWLLALKKANVNEVDLFSFDAAGKLTTHFHTGTNYPFYQRPIEHPNFLFPLNAPDNGIVTIYLRIATKGLVKFPLTMWEQEYFEELDQKRQLVSGVTIGMILIMVIYNGIIALIVREKYFAYFVIYTLSMGFVTLGIYGLDFQYLWQKSLWWNNSGKTVFSMMATVFGCLFILSILNIKQHNLWVDRSLKTLSIICVVSMFARAIFGYPAIYQFTATFGMIIVFSILLISIWRATKGDDNALLLTIAWAAPIAIIVFNYFLSSNQEKITPFEYGLEAGFLSQIIFMSIVLSKRINEDRHQRDLSKQTDRAKSEFLANMSHEIRTPINAIMGFTTLALQDYGRPDSYINKIDTAANSLLKIVNGILDYSKLEAEKLILTEENFEVLSIYDQLAEQFRKVLSTKPVELVFYFDDNLPSTLVGDSFRITQTLSQIIDNAIKFTDKGEILVRTNHEIITDNEVCLRISIQDSGIGIEKFNIKTLFDHFEQLDTTSTRDYGGTGLGLTICKRLIKLMGGHISVESSTGKGSTFYLSIPLKLPPIGDKRTIRQQLQLPNKLIGSLVLVAHENEAALLSIRDTFIMLGLKVVTTNRSQMARELLCNKTDSKKFQFAFIDWEFSDTNGLDLIEDIQDERSSDSIRFAYISAYLDTDIEFRAKSMGACACLVKPITPTSLYNWLQKHPPTALRKVKTIYQNDEGRTEENPSNAQLADLLELIRRNSFSAKSQIRVFIDRCDDSLFRKDLCEVGNLIDELRYPDAEIFLLNLAKKRGYSLDDE